jgi:hypothetical protein
MNHVVCHISMCLSRRLKIFFLWTESRIVARECESDHPCHPHQALRPPALQPCDRSSRLEYLGVVVKSIFRYSFMWQRRHRALRRIIGGIHFYTTRLRIPILM